VVLGVLVEVVADGLVVTASGTRGVQGYVLKHTRVRPAAVRSIDIYFVMYVYKYV
jgi:hypothetical protein